MELKCHDHVSKADFSMEQKTSCLCPPPENAVEMRVPNPIPPLTSTLPGYFSVALIGASWEMQAPFNTSLSKTIKTRAD